MGISIAHTIFIILSLIQVIELGILSNPDSQFKDEDHYATKHISDSMVEINAMLRRVVLLPERYRSRAPVFTSSPLRQVANYSDEL